MPGMDGYEVCKRLKQNAKSRDIPIIFLTVRSEVDDETKGFQLGAIDYITKPISPPIVKARVNTHLILEQTRDQLKKYNRQLEDTVAERTKDLTQEIMDRKNAEAQLYRLANYDSLTTLPNLILFREQLAQLIETAKANDVGVVLLLLDLADFKHLNKALGYVNGDALLQQTANRLLDTVQEANSIARIGADKFSIVMLETEGSNCSERICTNLSAAFQRPFRLETSQYFTKLRIGVAKLSPTSLNVDSLLNNAELALSHAKSELNGGTIFYSPQLSEDVRERATLARELVCAIEQNQLVLYFQPIYETSSLKLVGAEALVRWQHPDRGLLLPDEFIPIAEQSDLILRLGDWILHHACAAAQTWAESNPENLKIAVNIASRQCYYINYCLSAISRILQTTNLPADSLSLEISESAFIDAPPELEEKLNKLKSLGVEIALSHFGIGYSSMGLVRTFNVDRVKIDRSVIAELEKNSKGLALTKGILSMANALELHVTAEGVENQQQLDSLKSAGCEWIQGFFISKPLSADQFAEYLKNYRPGSS